MKWVLMVATLSWNGDLGSFALVFDTEADCRKAEMQVVRTYASASDTHVIAHECKLLERAR